MKRTILAALVIAMSAQLCRGEQPQMADPFVLDGLRYIKTQHDKESVVPFSNGVRGAGLTLSFFGKLDTKVLGVYSLNVNKVVLADGTGLAGGKVRTKSLGAANTMNKWGIQLGADRQSVGIEVDLDVPNLVNCRMISGRFMASVPSGSVSVETGTLEDRAQSVDKKSGVAVESCMDWGNRGRYYLLTVPNADKLQGVVVLDENGRALEQSLPFQSLPPNNLKLFVNKSKGSAFRLKLDMSKGVREASVPFSIGPVTIFGDATTQKASRTVGASGAGTRKWTAADGRYSVEAEFVEIQDGKVHLKKHDGFVISIDIEKLSPEDRDWLKHGGAGPTR